jgi:uncharacterized protein (DUF2384 family)
MHPLDEVHAFKSLLAVALPDTDTNEWLKVRNPVLGDRRPIDVFLTEGLDAVLPAVLAQPVDQRH